MNKLYRTEHLFLKLDVTKIDDLSLSSSVYTSDKLQKMKEDVNNAKKLLDEYSSNPLANKFNYIKDLYAPIKKIIKNDYNGQIVSNAWLKMYELIVQFNLIGDNEKIVTFHNAELPGAFICATNHYIKTFKPNIEFNWYASSLAPQEGVDALGDIYGIFAMNKEHWLMQVPNIDKVVINNGDATVPNNLIDWTKKLKPGVNLYTSDAGIDVTGQYEKQEEANSKIHLGCALAGLMTIAKGGNMVLKQYSCYETLTWNLIIIYATQFDEFYISKPLTSRPANSELYLVGKGYHGPNKELIKILMNKLMNFDMKPIIPSAKLKTIKNIYDSIVHFMQKLSDEQVAFLKQDYENFMKYGKNNNDLEHFNRKILAPIRKKLIYNWFTQYPVKKIDTADHIATKEYQK